MIGQINYIHSELEKITDAHQFEVGELYIQHCQQKENENNKEDIVRIFRVGENAAYDINEEQGNTLTLIDQPIYVAGLDEFEEGSIRNIEKMKITFNHYMGHFYHIYEYNEIQDQFGVNIESLVKAGL